ncbi:MAG: hypothetical protein RIC55_09575 [Pirellulaceae bacterium]
MSIPTVQPCPHRHRTLFFTAALLALGAAAPLVAAPPLPARFERMFGPEIKHVASYHFKTDWTSSYSSVAFNWSFTNNHRVVDLEIDDFDLHPTTKEGYNGGHTISVVEAPNKGSMKAENWVTALGLNEDGLVSLFNETPDPDTGQTIYFRPEDIEFYYRHNPFTGVLEPTYSCTAVENVGQHYANWHWLAPLPIAQLSSTLDIYQKMGLRAYDVEFAKDGDGHVMAMALLTDDEASGGYPLGSAWGWFEPWQVALLRDEGWLLIDMELNEGVFPGTFEPKTNWPAYFCLFINAYDLPGLDTATTIMDPTDWTLIEAYDVGGEALGGVTRLVDLEYAGTVKQESAGEIKFKPPLELEQATPWGAAYASAWLGE